MNWRTERKKAMGKRGRKGENFDGQKFGKLLAIEPVTTRKRHAYRCLCDCGNEIIVDTRRLKSGEKTSCGCEVKKRPPGKRKKFNDFDLSGEYGIGYDDAGGEFYFDLEDYDRISKYWWKIGQYGYPLGTLPRSKDGQRKVLLHRFLMNPPDDIVVDHINHIRHDCRKENLRVCTQYENMQNVTGRQGRKIGILYYLTDYPDCGTFSTKEAAKQALKEIEEKE